MADLAIPPSGSSRRVSSLDQFRGYTVVGMLLVNFVGGFAAIPAVLKHHNTYCSYADTIMPQFFFAVGYAYRLTYLKRRQRDGLLPALSHVLWRNLGLLLLGIVFYHLDGRAEKWSELQGLGVLGVLQQGFRREPFQTLVHIALASLWCLPVIGGSGALRLVLLLLTSLLHLGLSMNWYFELAVTRPVIDGGPLGFMTWSIPVLIGSFAYDWTIRTDRRGMAAMVFGAIGLMGLGYGLSQIDGAVPPPFFAPERPLNVWMMSQRTGSISYQLFAAGFSLAVYAAFVVIADKRGVSWSVFRTFGRNALATYLIHGMVFSAIKPYAPRDSPLWYALSAFCLAFLILYLFMRHLEREDVFIKL